MNREEVNFCIFISGFGRGAIEILKKSNELRKNGKNLCLIISSSYEFTNKELATKSAVDIEYILPQDFLDKEAFEKQLLNILKKYNIKHIFLAGFKYLLTNFFIKKFEGKMLNIHPSLLPSFKGHKNGIQQALIAGVKVTGVTIHEINEKMDDGKILYQNAIKVEKNDNFETLDKKIFTVGSEMSLIAIREQFQ
jgi:phosphoribosylglycinamide formyltransferase 1